MFLDESGTEQYGWGRGVLEEWQPTFPLSTVKILTCFNVGMSQLKRGHLYCIVDVLDVFPIQCD